MKKSKILFFGDSVTDMGHNREVENGNVYSYGHGFVFFVAGELLSLAPEKYEVVNRGIAGNRIYDLYARIKKDVWNESPDVLTILIGINDVESPWNNTGTDLSRWEKIYRMLIEETQERFPETKIILCEPFCVYVDEVASRSFNWRTERIARYRVLLEKFSSDYGCRIVWLHDKMNMLAQKLGAQNVLYDGTHPNIAGSKLIAEEWLKVFKSLEAETDRK